MNRRLDFNEVKATFKKCKSLNAVNKYYRSIEDNYTLSEKQDTAIWGFYSSRRAAVYVALKQKGAEGLFSPEFLKKYGDWEVNM